MPQQPRALLWYAIFVDEADAASPVKRRGPFTYTELADMFRKEAVDESTYVWAEGRVDDFQPVRSLPDLHDALLEDADGAPTKGAPGGTPKGGRAQDVRSARWFYRDAGGVQLGPSVLDTLKILWDYGELKEDTPVMSDADTEFKPLREVPDLLKALTLGVAALGPDAGAQQRREEKAAAAEEERAATQIQAAFRGKKARAENPVPKRAGAPVTAARREAELEARRREAQLAAREADVAARELEADRRVMEAATFAATARGSPSPRSTHRLYGGLATAAPPAAVRDLDDDDDDALSRDGAESDELPVARRVHRARGGYGGKQPRATSAADELLGPMPDIKLGRARFQTPDAFRSAAAAGAGEAATAEETTATTTTSKTTLAGALATVAAPHGAANGSGGPFTMFHGEMAALEAEYARVREKLEGEYGALHATLTAKLNDVSGQLQTNRRRIEEAERGMELEQQELERERARLGKERNRLTERRNRESAAAEAAGLQIDEARRRIGKEVERRERKVSEAERSLKEQRDVLQREQTVLDEEQRRATRERKEFLDGTAKARSDVEDARRQLDDDVVSFGKYRDEVEKLLEAKRALLKEEQEDFIKSRAETLNAMEVRQRELVTEVAAASEQRAAAEAEYNAAEAEWTQRGAYLDLQQGKVEEDRRAFEEYRTRVETEINEERKKLADHMRAIDQREQMSEDLFTSGRKRLERDRLHLTDKMESERRALEEQRLRHAREYVDQAAALGARSALYVGR